MAHTSQTRELVCGIPFLSRPADIAIFKKLGFVCVYATGPLSGRPIKVGRTNAPWQRFDEMQQANWRELKIHEITWLTDDAQARRLDAEVRRLLASRQIRGNWFDVPAEMVVPTFQVASDKLGIRSLTHEGVLERFEAMKQGRNDHLARKHGAVLEAAA